MLCNLCLGSNLAKHQDAYIYINSLSEGNRPTSLGWLLDYLASQKPGRGVLLINDFVCMYDLGENNEDLFFSIEI